MDCENMIVLLNVLSTKIIRQDANLSKLSSVAKHKTHILSCSKRKFSPLQVWVHSPLATTSTFRVKGGIKLAGHFEVHTRFYWRKGWNVNSRVYISFSMCIGCYNIIKSVYWGCWVMVYFQPQFFTKLIYLYSSSFSWPWQGSFYIIPYSTAYRCPLFSFFKCKYWVDQPYYPYITMR